MHRAKAALGGILAQSTITQSPMLKALAARDPEALAERRQKSR